MVLKRNTTYRSLCLALLLTTGPLANDSSNPVSIPSHSNEEYGYSAALENRFQQCDEFHKQEAALLAQASDEADMDNICTEEVFFDLTKITERKKKLENLCVIIDESKKRVEKYQSELLQWMLAIPLFDADQRKEIKTIFTQAKSAFGEQGFAIRKELARELINLLNFLSMRYGTYKLINKKKDLAFSSEIESKLYNSYIVKIKKLFKKEHEAGLSIEKRHRDIFNGSSGKNRFKC